MKNLSETLPFPFIARTMDTALVEKIKEEIKDLLFEEAALSKTEIESRLEEKFKKEDVFEVLIRMFRDNEIVETTIKRATTGNFRQSVFYSLI